jgi:hypothetical protein
MLLFLLTMEDRAKYRPLIHEKYRMLKPQYPVKKSLLRNYSKKSKREKSFIWI